MFNTSEILGRVICYVHSCLVSLTPPHKPSLDQLCCGIAPNIEAACRRIVTISSVMLVRRFTAETARDTKARNDVSWIVRSSSVTEGLWCLSDALVLRQREIRRPEMTFREMCIAPALRKVCDSAAGNCVWMINESGLLRNRKAGRISARGKAGAKWISGNYANISQY
jgi:hypothetical protein